MQEGLIVTADVRVHIARPSAARAGRNREWRSLHRRFDDREGSAFVE
ncbi:MAG: hypothetical protein IRY83_18035 [Chloroflexi bacterium]|nr:hypothetical protein [Chloroflexota bacterium]